MVSEKVIEIVSDVLELEPEEVSLDSKIVADLGADSLDIVDLSFTLGKQLNIKMPQKSVMMHAEEIVEDASSLAVDGRLTELGAKLLRAGPNAYSEAEASTGKSLAEVFVDTNVQHWVNLCEAITASGLTGDELIKNTVESVLEAA